MTDERAAGGLLLTSLLTGLAALVILLLGGAAPGFSAALRGPLAALAPYAATFRVILGFWAAAWVVQLLGFGLLARLLLRAGAEQVAILAFLLVLVAALVGFLQATQQMSVMTWAAEEAARTGSVPQAYEVVHVWVGTAFRAAYRIHLLAEAVFGWGIWRAGLAAPWLGQAAIAWSVLWLAGALAGVGAPGVLFLMPAAVGVALLLRSK